MDHLIAKAKVNIGLNILRYNKKYGKHKIRSLFMLVDEYFDEVYIDYNKDKDDVYYIMNNQYIFIENDLVIKTLNFMKERFKINDFFQITIVKNIPFMAGLGGSSSDAGTIIKFLVSKYNLVLTKKTKKEIAIYLGSDVCFFVSGYELSLVNGYGEKIKRINKQKPKYEIIANNYSCSTKKVYEIFRECGTRTINDFKKIINNLLNIEKVEIYNDLQNCALMINKEMLNYYNELAKNKKIILSGSGSYFVSFTNS